MKDNARKLRLMLRRIDPNLFYVITIHNGIISFQGKFNPQVVIYLRNHKFVNSISINGYVEFSRSNIKVTLT